MLLAPPDVFRVALRSLVKGGYFSPVQAARLARTLRIDLGWLPGNDPLDVTLHDAHWPLVYLELLALIQGIPHGLPRARWEDARDYIASLKISDLMQVHERVQDRFEQHNRRLTGLLFAGGLTLVAWRQSLWSNIRRLILQQAVLGAGMPPHLPRVRTVLSREAGYFEQFAVAVFAGHVAQLSGAEPMRAVPRDAVTVERRADLYAGSARGLFYEFHEERANLGHGWVVYYECKDDANSCKPCRAAAGYHLPQVGPFPGAVCQGQGKCRCRRKPVFAPEIYARLMREAG
jgi:hypothetical protein